MEERKPLTKNQTVRAVIEGYSSEGLGIARVGGQVVFVHRAIRGEECDILMMKVLKHAAFGKVTAIHTPSPHRQDSDCPYYGRCGGCDFRHMDYAEELEAKRARVQDALQRLGGSAVQVEEIFGAAETRYYRNKSQYPVGTQGAVGFYRARSHEVIPVECCLIQRPEADAAAEALRAYIRRFRVSCYDEVAKRACCVTSMSAPTLRVRALSACWATGTVRPMKLNWLPCSARQCPKRWVLCGA